MKISDLKKSNLLACAFLCWGCSAMLGDVFSIPMLKGLGLASGAAPYTKVFCQAEARDGGGEFETFAAEFWLHYKRANGTVQSIELTPELYQKLKGPYQRRNVYGAVLAYGPALPEDMKRATLHYALVSPGNLTDELDLPDDASHFSIQMISHTRGNKNQWLSKP